MARKTKKQYSGIGGQAVLEGIMMKNKDQYAVAVRKPNGRIEVKVDEYKSSTGDNKFFKLPFIRGVFNFYDSLTLGMRSLNYSASFYEDEVKEETVADKVVNKISDNHAEAVFSTITVIISFVFAIGLFMVLPYFLADILAKYVRNESLLALLEALIRVFIFLIYVVSISLMKDIRRVYQYHGAEHKCINCLERGRELTVKNVKRASRLHNRCGTSFLLFVVLISAILFFFIRVDQVVLRLLLRIALIPVIAGIAYEILRLAGKSDNVIVHILSLPGLWLQKLTTKEPDEDMIEVAIASIEAVFDWKKYLLDTFDINVEENEEIYAEFHSRLAIIDRYSEQMAKEAETEDSDEEV